MPRLHRLCCLALFATLAVSSGGCGNAGPVLPPTVPITAKVTVDGQPLRKAKISFSPAESGPTSNGIVVDGDVVELWTNARKPGAVIGDHQVTIYDQPMEAEPLDLVPDRYGRISGGIPVVVTEEGPNEFLFELSRK
ncbi:MAG: hypothetical protein ACIALR_15540 [Blastopirellula sp. JB062]